VESAALLSALSGLEELGAAIMQALGRPLP
jgi:hypothetical protein